MKKRKCPECQTHKVRKVGKVITRRGLRQRYQCTKCARTFY